jgi:hypothetical protein
MSNTVKRAVLRMPESLEGIENSVERMRASDALLFARLSASRVERAKALFIAGREKHASRKLLI